MPRCSFAALLVILAMASHLGCTRLDERPGEAPAAAPGGPTSTTASTRSTSATSITGTASTAITANPSPSPATTTATSAEKSPAADFALGRAAFSRYCGECHDGRLPTAKPKALAIFDLTDARWIEKLSPRQVEAAKGRLKGKATDAEKLATTALLDGRGRRGEPDAGR